MEAIMLKRSVIVLVLVFVSVLLLAEIGSANSISGINNSIQFGGRQAVYANGDTIMFCYVQYPEGQTIPKNGGQLNFASSFDGGQSFQTLQIYGQPDGAPTLFKDGQTVIITFTADGYLWKFVSHNNGQTFQTDYPDWQNPTILGSDRLPITDKYDGEFHSLYNYQEFAPDYYNFESPFSQFFGTYTDNDQSTNATNQYYWGPDVVYGKLRVNGDLWVKQMGGGNNGGWPTFNGPVYVTGVIQSYSGTLPYAQIFRAGYLEHVPELSLGSSNIAGTTLIGPANYDPNRIMMVSVNGDVFTSYIGNIVYNDFDTLRVYSNYPPGDGVELYANVIPHADTLWTTGPSGSLDENHVLQVNSPLWLKGNFSGTQVWYSPDNIYLINDITLTNTPVGQAPDGTIAGSTINQTDKVAIVSDKSIFIQYGYKDPVSGLRMKPNCDGDQQGIWIYASLYALGDGNGNSHEDGVFTFEYQHPHASVPALNLEGTLYDKIDLHRRTFPQTGTFPWPGNIDYPFYNPLWPEGNPTLERGTVHIWGSIIQRRRGYMHRSMSDAEYPNPGAIWNTDLDLAGGPSGMSYIDPVLGTNLSPANAAGTTGAGVGYKKDFHFDNRIKSDTFGFNPWNFGIRVDSATELGDWQNNIAKSLNIDMVTKTYDRKFGQTLFSINHRLFRLQNDAVTELNINNEPEGNIIQLNLLDATHALIYIHDKNIGFMDTGYTPDTLHVCILDLNEGSLTSVNDGLAVSEMNDTAILNNGLKVFAKTIANNDVQLYAVTQDSQLAPLYTWNPNQPMLASDSYDFSKARLHIVPSGGDSLCMFIWLPIKLNQATYFPWFPVLTNGALFIARGSIANTAIEDNTQVTEVEVSPSVSNSPNPFVNSTNIKVNLPKDANVTLNVYNVKGELIKSFAKGFRKAGVLNLNWDGKDSNGKSVSSGLYYYQCSADKHTLTGKMVLLK
jgi:hypothetical protein